jgi:hypothetical protein
MSAAYKPNMKLFEKQRDPDLRADYSPGIGREAKSNKFADAKQGDATEYRFGHLTVRQRRILRKCLCAIP